MNNKKRYDGLDFLKSMACIGIVMMHMRTNNNYDINGYIWNRGVLLFTDFVFLFMVVSAFGLCVGYYDKVLAGSFDVRQFYGRRYKKILPFFSVLVVLDLAQEFSIERLYEAFADVTLLFGLFPCKMSVIGVGWFLGLIFAFYMIFPFFCFLINNRYFAWFSFIVALAMNYICDIYFDCNRLNIVFSLCFFLAGGLIYLYREKLEKLHWGISTVLLVISIVTYYAWVNTFTQLCVAFAFMLLALGKAGTRLGGPIVKKFSAISMEVFLSHMIIFRILEKLHINYLFGNGLFQYIFTVLSVIIGAVVFAVVLNKFIELFFKFIDGRIKNE